MRWLVFFLSLAEIKKAKKQQKLKLPHSECFFSEIIQTAAEYTYYYCRGRQAWVNYGLKPCFSFITVLNLAKISFNEKIESESLFQ